MLKSETRRTWKVSEQKIVGARQKWRCNVCECLLPSAYELDHIIPLWKGGQDDYEVNAQALCGNCHNSKTQLERLERDKLNRQSSIVTVLSARLKADSLQHDNPFAQFAYIPGI